MNSAVFLPLIAAALGAAGAGLVLLLPPQTGATAAIAFWTAATLARGERGIYRWFPSLPVFGSLLAACTLLLRWYAVVSLPRSHVMLAAIASHEMAAAGAVALALVARPADEETSERHASLNTMIAMIVFAQAAIVVAFTGLRLALVLALTVYLVVRVLLAFTTWRFGGVRRTDLSAAFVVLSTLELAVLSSFNRVW
jgi:cobalamin synthase